MTDLSHGSRLRGPIHAVSAVSGLREAFRRRVNARQVAQSMLSLDDRSLNDIGLTRIDLLAAQCRRSKTGR
jgi:uncharacterized protein YjiS (DUF1127 family)